jgi:hypothetical protein
MYYNCIDSGRDRSVTLTWADAPCVNCGFIVDTPTFDITPAFVVDTPTFDIVPVEGAVEPVEFFPLPYMYSYGYPVPVRMSCPTPSSTIYYTVDGSEPSDGSTEYTGVFSASAGVVKAIAYASGLDPSVVVTLPITSASAAFYTKITDSSLTYLTIPEFNTDYVLAFPISFLTNPCILYFDLPVDGGSKVRHILLASSSAAPTGFFEDTGSVVPITLLGPVDGFNYTDANGNPYAYLTNGAVTNLNIRHYACAAGDGATYGFNVKLTF